VSRDPSAPPDAVADHWNALLEDARATAADYREDGWTTLVIHTAEVGVRLADPLGLDIIAPDNEFEELHPLLEDTPVDVGHVFRADADGVRFLLVVLEAPASGEAVLLPAYLTHEDVVTLRRQSRDETTLEIYVRTIADDERITLDIETVDPFVGEID
jgi:hypothetical protein